MIDAAKSRPTQYAWHSGQWLAHNQAALALDDRGVLQGAMVVERLRTCDGDPLDVDSHVGRLLSGGASLFIDLPDQWDLPDILSQCAERNAAYYYGQDFSLVAILTPGRISETSPTLLVHTASIDWLRLNTWYSSGQPLVVAENQNVPRGCWPPQIKNRSRLHYYLADQFATHFDWGGLGVKPGCGAILPDIQGGLTETSIANILIVESGRLVSPRLEHILHGVSLKRTLRLARAVGIEVAFEDISTARAQKADELLLCGTTGGLWSASCLGEREFPPPNNSPVLFQLTQAWIADLGWDFVQQATQLSSAD